MIHHLIDEDGNRVVMTSVEFNRHKELNESKSEKRKLKFDMEWYLSHGYHTFDEVFKKE